MTFGVFIFGALLFMVGFLIIWKTTWFLNNMGDISELFGAVGMRWLSWKGFGVALMIIGFLVAFNLLQLFLGATVGRLFTVGSL